MLRIIDARTGEAVLAAPVRRGPTRIEAHVSGHGTGALRVLLVTDLLVRALELDSTPVRAVLTGEADRAVLRAGAADLGIHPLEEGHEPGGWPAERQVLRVAAEGDAGADGVQVVVGDVLGEAPSDPTVLRLALLERPRTETVRLDAAVLSDAHDTLVRWRRAVAAWARQPSRPVPDEVRGRLRAAWEDDLDVPAVLRVLRSVADAGPELPDGARFETYAYADRLLGLELTRDIGAAP
ncbi:hypothetical protein [Streptomyces antibioticus]|uniref:hypothetical protein n=1 Tax=Streptomyces antibioticus TaxID=1890 RepID=UPI00339FF2F4